jgi:hypothetical protein
MLLHYIDVAKTDNVHQKPYIQQLHLAYGKISLQHNLIRLLWTSFSKAGSIV